MLFSLIGFLLELIAVLILFGIVCLILIPFVTYTGYLISEVTEKPNWASKLHKKLF